MILAESQPSADRAPDVRGWCRFWCSAAHVIRFYISGHCPTKCPRPSSLAGAGVVSCTRLTYGSAHRSPAVWLRLRLRQDLRLRQTGGRVRRRDHVSQRGAAFRRPSGPRCMSCRSYAATCAARSSPPGRRQAWDRTSMTPNRRPNCTSTRTNCPYAPATGCPGTTATPSKGTQVFRLPADPRPPRPTAATTNSKIFQACRNDT